MCSGLITDILDSRKRQMRVLGVAKPNEPLKLRLSVAQSFLKLKTLFLCIQALVGDW